MKALKQNNIEQILHGSLYKAILSLAIPVVINSFLQTMYNLTDTYWLGKIGTEQLAAINLVTPLQNIIINFGSGITVAGAVLIAQYIGAGEKEDARSMANQIFLCAMIFGIACSSICFLATPGIVGWLGAEGDTFAHSVTFLRVVIWDMAFLFMVNIFQSVHQAQGNTLKPMLLNLCGISINMILDPLFMIVLQMGVAGAALATLTAKAAYGIGNRVNGLITLPSNGIGSATATIVGQNMGAKQRDRAEQGYKISMRICVTFLFIGGMILSRDAISTAIVSIFSEDPEVIAMAADFLSIMAFWCFTNGVYNASTGLFQGTGHTEVTMAVDATRLWVFRFLTLWFCETILHMGVRSVWYSVVVSNGISSVILYCLYRAGIWKKVKIKIDKRDKENVAEIREQKA